MAEEMQQDEMFEQAQNGNGEAEATESETPTQQQTTEAVDDEDEDDRKLFVGGLSWETSTKDLREYFENFGEVSGVTLKTDLETKKSRGFGFVTFASAETLEKVLDQKKHELHKRTIDPKKANPRPINKKVFVGKLDPAVSEDDVRTYFEQFGPVEKIELPFDKTKEQRRAFCFVEFKKVAAMIKCLEHKGHKVGTSEVDVKKATLPQGGGMRGGSRGRGFGGGMRGGRGGFQGGYNYNQGYGGGGYGGYGYGGYPPYDYGGYGYGDYGGYGGYGYNQWNGGGGYDSYGYGQSNFGKAQKRGAGGYHPYNR